MFFGGDFFRFFDGFGLAVQVADTSTNSGEPWHLESKVFGLYHVGSLPYSPVLRVQLTVVAVLQHESHLF